LYTKHPDAASYLLECLRNYSNTPNPRVSTKILNETYTQGLTGFCQHQGNTAALTDQPNSLSPHSSFLSLVMLPTNFPAPPSFLPLPASSHLLPRGLRQSTVSFPEHKGKEGSRSPCWLHTQGSYQGRKEVFIWDENLNSWK